MEIKERKDVVINKIVVVGYKCDACGKVSPSDTNCWQTLRHQHNGWANDSVESIEDFDLCSLKCFTTQLGKSLIAMESNKGTAEIAGYEYPFAKELYLGLEHLIK